MMDEAYSDYLVGFAGGRNVFSPVGTSTLCSLQSDFSFFFSVKLRKASNQDIFMELWEQLFMPEKWQEFLEYKTEKQHLSSTEAKELKEYIKKETYLLLLSQIATKAIPLPLPNKKEVNKSGVAKKRVVYSFPKEFSMLLKMVAYLLYRYDHLFTDNCYAFRRTYGVKDAVRRIRTTQGLHQKYCLKVDISNYFNSIHVPMLLEKLLFLKVEDEKLYEFLERLLTANQAICKEDGQERIITENRGAMAGTPISPFLANVYLMDIDHFFEQSNIMYFRYSDDILLFADSREELEVRKQQLYERLWQHHLTLNPSKVHISEPKEAFEFLGFRFDEGRVELSDSTLQKIKDKIKRKAHALRRWQQKKKLSGECAAKGFIKAMNHKFYDSGDGTNFSWSRWFFPCLTSDERLKEIDAYMQQYVRFCVTGRHYKGNYRITYEQIKQWGYRSLVHEFWAWHNEVK